MDGAPTTLLDISGLSVEFSGGGRTARVLNDVALTVAANETLGIVGESGCGKSMTALAILRLVPSPPGRITGGRIVFGGEDLLQAPEQRLRDVRGHRIGMIFQEPMTSLNPVLTIGDQLSETLIKHLKLDARAARARSIELLKAVGIPAPERRVDEYPHQLSGGMRQRVMIAMAIGCEPQLLIADEPTTALDVTVQAQIFELLRELRARSGMGLILITHDMGVIAEMTDRVAVMYGGRVVEEAPTADILSAPAHPYTRGLIACVPDLDAEEDSGADLLEIAGMVPSVWDLPKGCPFADRCAEAMPRCVAEMPPTSVLSAGHRVACWLQEGTGP
ncbi:ABC transporter ATP-binding protein [Reyranella sp.]|jgi:peptide/nickel transport system ATP-binding protein|uniref:ABC transporter ATP-binding protein n=1 Tax=Reyranella sp. TaxID=1929291 RepID=UPI000BD8B20B|nr:ABC transporter ATP-binding protein [Reyranella sp.]OYY41337.1 MAG: peptide ABC transporter ATP-binding protein [Rhodospirillales bacterium 35-66-84]OYZ93535.1 MAG: peptide ABC transporter ATP-binding protein [Rhodospirillales bacterium 24-66-33]OZB21770.1 MAG: peptide ABC transporter ATP-binding protein [Rhodospirillales bacterium 39-66-50]HQS16293.1 ABC transporter ATP-binding protein [Reyranella sp.]HQT12124.1 ABC transporter ATP-binding protein [Reyranella sp.]